MEHLEILKKELADGSAQLLDVREYNEWQSQLEGYQEPDDAEMDVKTYIHCRSGQRVQLAKPILEEMGFDEVIALREGFVDLAAYGFEVE